MLIERGPGQSPVEVIQNFETGQRIGQAAMSEDFGQFRYWLLNSFPATVGPKPYAPFDPDSSNPEATRLDGVAASNLPIMQVWQAENCAAVLRSLGGTEPVDQAIQTIVQSGHDWLDPQDDGWKCLAIVEDVPPLAATPEMKQLIDSSTVRISGYRAQSYGGLIVRVPGMVCQLSRVVSTGAVNVKARGLAPDTLLMRAWRTPSTRGLDAGE